MKKTQNNAFLKPLITPQSLINKIEIYSYEIKK